MTEELASRYQFADVEQKIYERWESSGSFVAKVDSQKPKYSVVIPPPNVTGVLHMGHALNNSMQDIMIRFHRKRGKECLWLPGTDHAGIATQAVVEKKLFKEQQKTREEMGREAFLEEIFKWKDEHGNIILQQLRRLGCSCDWSRTRFTMDDELSVAVREAFVRLWEKGLVYRGARLVNWDCKLKTAVSDDEIEHVERKTHLWHLRYPLEDDPSKVLVVATTRPETMLGDTGVAVHPEDERYRDFVGKKVRLPLVGRSIPVIADETVEREFGTGAVKLTPGHDPADYERGKRFGLPIVNVLTEDGRINGEGGEYEGLSREQARKKVVEDLDAQGFLEKIEDYEHSVAISDRSGTVIEPLVSEQWFVKMEPLAQPAIAAVKNGSLRFVPERWTKVYLSWLENVRDWCISRQLWWGHRIPVWYDEDDVPVASRDELNLGDAHPKTGKPLVRQDEDVLDTWASSWLWPFATMGWPQKHPDLDRFYPTDFLGTARDIIYLWVARMVMAGYEFMDHLPMDKRCPFSVCYINATVLDAKGRRMSKSLGNGIDPVDLIDRYGADALRISLALATVEGQDIKFSEQRTEEGRNFVNKLWNAARFVLSNLPDGELLADVSQAKSLEDRWILHELKALTNEVTDLLENCKYHDAAQALRRFVWNSFCDWYLEIVKVRFQDEDESSRQMAQAVTARVLTQSLHLLHPITPFVTEALGDHVRSKGWDADTGSLVTAAWPGAEDLPEWSDAAQSMEALQAMVTALRNLRARNDVPERKEVNALLKLPDASLTATVEEARSWFQRLSRAKLDAYAVDVTRPDGSDADVVPVAPFGTAEVYLPLEGLIDKEARAADCRRKIEKLDQRISQLAKRLDNENFVKNAPEAVVQKERDKLNGWEEERSGLQRMLEQLS